MNFLNLEERQNQLKISFFDDESLEFIVELFKK